MSGVAKDETNPVDPADETSAAPVESSVQPPEHVDDVSSAVETEARNAARRAAPHLRVVADNQAAEAAASGTQKRIGAIIRAAREDHGLTLETVAKETRIHLSHLRAIEDMTPNLLGAPVYAKGYIRNYARHLKLDPDEILSRYLSECAILTDPEKQEIAPPVVARKLPVAAPVLGLLVIALAIAGAAVFLFNSGEKGATPAQTAAGAGTDLSMPAVAAGPPLRLVAISRARIEVRGADGTKFLARFFSPGESYTPRVGAGWTVTTENGAAFEWRLGDDSLGLLAAEGGPVFAQSVDGAVLREPLPKPVAAAPPPAPRASESEANALDPEAPVTRTATTPAPPRAQPQPQPPKPQPPTPQPQARAAAPTQAAAPPAAAPTTAIAPPPAETDPAMLAYPSN